MPDHRLVYVIDTLTRGGAERHLTRVLPALSPQWRPSVYCLDRRGPFVATIEAMGIEMVGPPSEAVALPHLYRYLRREKPRIVHAYLLRAGLVGSLAARVAGVPHVITTRRIVHTYTGAKRLQYRLTTRLMDLASDRVVAVCETARQQAIAEGTPAHRISTIYNGVPLMPAPGVPERPAGPVFGTVAALHSRKGHRYLLDAIPRVAHALPGARFVIAGDGPERPALEAQTRALGIEDRVTFLGDRRNVPDLLATFDALVLPSISEGLPNIVLEAMAVGVPVAATAVGGVPEIVLPDRTGLLVPPADPDALAAALICLGRDSCLRRRLASEALDMVRNRFHPDAEVAAMEALYREMLCEPVPVTAGAVR